MKGERSTSQFVAGMIMIAGAVLALPSHAKTASPAPSAALEILTGPADAAVSIVVFSDYSCPYSSQLYFQLEALEKKYPAQLRAMLKQLPLEIHPQSPLAHEAALAAAAQGKLGAMSELLFANQKRLDRDSLLAYARQLHLDMPAFRQAMDSHLYRPLVEEDLLEARALGIDSTPTIFLNGHRLDGFQSLEVLDKEVAQELVKQNDAQTIDASAAGEENNESIGQALFDKLKESVSAVRGPATAPVTIVEFTDFQCPFCRQSAKPLEDLLAQRPNQVRLIFRSFPLDFHQYSELAHEAALAAGDQGKFWQMYDLLFANQSHLERADLLRYAEQLQLDVPAFEKALDAHTYAGAIASDRALGAQLDVNGTPTFFINGKRLTGVRTLVELEQLVDQEARVAQGAHTEQAAVTPAKQDTNFLVLGSEASPIQVTWFTDVRSPLAMRAAALIHVIDQAYPGQLRVQYKSLQLANHADAELASRALIAAGSQQKFWPMYEALAASATQLDRDTVLKTAAAVGLEPQAFQEALNDPSITESIERDQAEVYRRAITGTPAIFIGGVRIDGLQPDRVYKSAIDAAFAARGEAQTAASGR
jgi:protein-disulfide isomerase